MARMSDVNEKACRVIITDICDVFFASFQMHASQFDDFGTNELNTILISIVMTILKMMKKLTEMNGDSVEISEMVSDFQDSLNRALKKMPEDWKGTLEIRM